MGFLVGLGCTWLARLIASTSRAKVDRFDYEQVGRGNRRIC
jgi:hypothetical protein